jgi:thymidylate kinase
LDIAVDPRNLQNLTKSILNAQRIRVVNVLQHESTCYYFTIWEEGQFVLVDSATDYRRDGRVWLTAQEMLGGTRMWNGIRVAGPRVEFEYLLLKKILKQHVPARTAARMGELARELGEEAERIARRWLGAREAQRVVLALRQGQWQPSPRELARLKRVLKWRRFLEDPLNPLRYWVPEILRVLRRLREPTGLVVAVLGLDGSGKTSVGDAVERRLAQAFRRIRREHFLPWWPPSRRNAGPVTDPHGAPPRGPVSSALKLAYYLAEAWLGQALRVWPAKVRSTLVLFDRYYHDLLADPRRYRYGGPMGLAHFVGRLVPKPDLFIVLDLPAEVAHARKPEVPLEEARRLRERYLALARSLPNAHVVDASRPLEDVVAEVEQILLSHLSSRAAQRLRAWGLLDSGGRR